MIMANVGKRTEEELKTLSGLDNFLIILRKDNKAIMVNNSREYQAGYREGLKATRKESIKWIELLKKESLSTEPIWSYDIAGFNFSREMLKGAMLIMKVFFEIDKED